MKLFLQFVLFILLNHKQSYDANSIPSSALSVMFGSVLK